MSVQYQLSYSFQNEGQGSLFNTELMALLCEILS